MKLPILLWGCLFLGGCVVIVEAEPSGGNTPDALSPPVAPDTHVNVHVEEPSTGPTSAEPTPTCERLHLPDPPKLPNLPDLTKATVRTQTDVEEALTDHIFAVRQQYRQYTKVIVDRYQAYVSTCPPEG